MVSRETRLQLGLLGLVVGGAALASLLGSVAFLAALAFVLWYVLLIAGANLYYASRGTGGSVPVDARWRFVALVVVASVLAMLAQFVGRETVAGTRLSTLAWAAAGAMAVAYVAHESWDAYLATQPD